METKQVSPDRLRVELLEYLRNLQRVEETRSKINGTSGWILLVAIAYFGNWLLTHLDSPEFQYLVQVGLAVALLPFFLTLISPSRSAPIESNKFRVMASGRDGDVSALPFNVIGLILFLFPVWASYVLVGVTFPVVFGVFFAVIGVLALLVFPLANIVTKKPLIRVLDQGGQWSGTVLGLIALLCLVLHARTLSMVLTPVPPSDLLFVAHVAAFWLVIVMFFRTIARSAITTRYLRLEESLIFGLTTPEEILRKLESESLGASLEDELESRESLIAAKHEIYEREISIFQSTVEDVAKIPIEYANERLTRIEKGYVPVEKAFNDLIGALDDKMQYISSILRAGKINIRQNALQILEKDSKRLSSQLVATRASTTELSVRTRQLLGLQPQQLK
jgi:hypothetical protein